MSKLFQELKDLKAAYDTKLKNEGENALKEVFKEFFEANPEVRSVYWTQYTNYFNDGDPCYFSVHELNVSFKADGPDPNDDYGADGEDYDHYKLNRSNEPRKKEIGKALKELEIMIPEDVFENVFGDHVQVIATKDGFSISEVSHD